MMTEDKTEWSNWRPVKTTPSSPQEKAATYPGDTVEITVVERGDEVGDVRIQWFDPCFRVGSFLPGIVFENPGDTRKVEPERSTWCSTRYQAECVYQEYLGAAAKDGWRIP